MGDLTRSGDHDSGTPRTSLRCLGTDVGAEPGLNQRLRLHRAGEAPQQHRRRLVVRPEQQDLPRMRVRRPGLGVEVVPVVPHRDQAQVSDGREGRGPGADGHLHLPSGHGQECPVASLWAGVGGQDDVAAGPEAPTERRVEPGDVAGVGQAHDAAATGVQGGKDRLGDRLRPVDAG